MKHYSLIFQKWIMDVTILFFYLRYRNITSVDKKITSNLTAFTDEYEEATIFKFFDNLFRLPIPYHNQLLMHICCVIMLLYD